MRVVVVTYEAFQVRIAPDGLVGGFNTTMTRVKKEYDVVFFRLGEVRSEGINDDWLGGHLVVEFQRMNLEGSIRLQVLKDVFGIVDASAQFWEDDFLSEQNIFPVIIDAHDEGVNIGLLCFLWHGEVVLYE